MENGAGRTRKRRHQPGPVAGNVTAAALLIGDVTHELLGGRVMIDDRDTRPAKRMQDRRVQLDHCAVFPERQPGAKIKAHAGRHDRQKIVTTGVSEVSAGDFRGHVIAAEGGGCKTGAATDKGHV